VLTRRNYKKGRFVCRLHLWSCFQTIKQYAEEGEFDANSVVIAIFPDHGSRYMSKIFSDDWMHDQGFFDSINEEDVQKLK
jgi:cystathionine beta-synthase